MTPARWLTLALAYTTLPCAVAAIAWARPRIRAKLDVGVCPRCGYSLKGLGIRSICPECGASPTMARPRLGLVGAVERVGVALLPAAITATVATSITLRMRPADDVRVILLITVAPYAIPALLILIKYRPEKPSLTLPSTVTLACLGNLILAIVMRTYWSSPVDNEDFGWPVTDIALLSLAYAILFLVAIPVWVIARPASSGGWRR